MARPRRGSTALSGIVLVDKPLGWTSHDVVAKLRTLSGEGRIGHAGTLDPAASGLLVMLIGAATSLAPSFLADVKRYRATLCFGAQTTTDDAEGEVVASSVPSLELFDEGTALRLLASFVGKQQQIPPDFAALKIGGKVGYKQARKGETLDFKPRDIEVFAADFICCDAQAQTWTIDFTVSKGTYIRALARDIGLAAKTHAHLCGLRRLASGAFLLDDAHRMEDLSERCDKDPLAIADSFCSRELVANALPSGMELPWLVSDPRIAPAIVAIGVFDGVHEGHRALLHSVVTHAQEQGLVSAAVTFDVLPETVLHPTKPTHALMSLNEKVAAIKACGIEEVVVLPFTQALAQQSPEDFLLKTLPARLQLRAIEVGENFRCGNKGAGTPELMRQILEPYHISVTAHPLVTDATGTPISSTSLRP